MRAMMAAPLAAILAAWPAHAQDAAAIAGEYVHSQMELAAGIRLDADGTFLYGLTVGSLDQRAQGRWTVADGVVTLTSDPKPVRPTVTAGPVETAAGQPFAMRVVSPRGNDVPGVDFVMEFDTGEPLESYMSGDSWSLPEGETRTPRFVTFVWESYGLRSDRLPIDARSGTVATFLLTPNDFGVVDLTGARGRIEGDTLTVDTDMGSMKFRRVKPRKDGDAPG